MDATTKTTPQSAELVPVDSIQVPDNWRTLDEESVESLTQSIREVGLIHPITISPDRTLVAGRHRLEAVRRLGWDSILAVVADGNPAHQELITIDENLRRKALNRYDEMTALARRKQIHEELHPETRHGGTRTAGTKREGAKSFTIDTSEKTGYHKDSVSRLVRIRNSLIDLPASLNHHPIVGSMTELELLSRQAREEQQVIVGMLESGEVKTVKEAVAARDGHEGADHGGNGAAAVSVDSPNNDEPPEVHHGAASSWRDASEDDRRATKASDVDPSPNGDRQESQRGVAPSCANGNGEPAIGNAPGPASGSYVGRINAIFDQLRSLREELGGPAEIAEKTENLRPDYLALQIAKGRREGPEVFTLPPPPRWRTCDYSSSPVTSRLAS